MIGRRSAYLEKRDEVFWLDFEAAVAQHTDNPRQQIVAVFAALQTMITSPQSLGCPFLNAASEFPEPDHVAHQVALAHKQKVRERLAQLGAAAGAQQSELLADHLLLALDGAFGSKRVFRNEPNPASQLTAMVELLLTAYLRS